MRLALFIGFLGGVAHTMQPGQWSGVGCSRKACVEIAGDNSSP